MLTLRAFWSTWVLLCLASTSAFAYCEDFYDRPILVSERPAFLHASEAAAVSGNVLESRQISSQYRLIRSSDGVFVRLESGRFLRLSRSSLPLDQFEAVAVNQSFGEQKRREELEKLSVYDSSGLVALDPIIAIHQTGVALWAIKPPRENGSRYRLYEAGVEIVGVEAYQEAKRAQEAYYAQLEWIRNNGDLHLRKFTRRDGPVIEAPAGWILSSRKIENSSLSILMTTTGTYLKFGPYRYRKLSDQRLSPSGFDFITINKQKSSDSRQSELLDRVPFVSAGTLINESPFAVLSYRDIKVWAVTEGREDRIRLFEGDLAFKIRFEAIEGPIRYTPPEQRAIDDAPTVLTYDTPSMTGRGSSRDDGIFLRGGGFYEHPDSGVQRKRDLIAADGWPPDVARLLWQERKDQRTADGERRIELKEQDNVESEEDGAPE